jgi:predicted dehydrogenase
VEWVAVCDVYDVRRSRAAALGGGSLREYADHRRVLEHQDIDAVIVATPDHWHAAITVDALNAGKDVYVEKPMVHHPKDGQAIVAAARAGRRIVQVGTQGRALPQFTEAKSRYIDTGMMGKIGLARTWYTSNRGYIQKAPPGMETKPAGLDWERWQGPGPKVAWNPDIYFSPYKWLHYCGGMVMGIGIHVVDSAHHWLDLTHPEAAVAGGGISYYDDGRDTPDVVSFILEYPKGVTVTFEAEALSAPGVRTTAGVMIRGTGGTLMAERYVVDTGWEYVPNGQFSKAPPQRGPGTQASAENLLRNWLECMRSRRSPVASEVAGYYSSVACYMANQAFYKKARVTWNRQWDLKAA